MKFLKINKKKEVFYENNLFFVIKFVRIIFFINELLIRRWGNFRKLFVLVDWFIELRSL